MNPIIRSFALFSVCFIFLLGNVFSEESKIVKYDTQTFTENINLKNHFVMFYAPWCSHCQRLYPIWEQLADLLNEEGSRVTIAQVDCTTETVLCAQQDITGYPTLKYFSPDKLEPVKYKDIHFLTHLTMFLNVQMGSSLGTGELEEVENVGVKELTDDNYTDQLSKGNHFVKFYAPWCGHCQKLAPTWEELGKTYVKHKEVTINKVDCTVNKQACRNFGIKSYPTLLWIEKGQQIDKFQGQRNINNFKHYIEEKLIQLNSMADKITTEDVQQPSSPVLSLVASNFKSTVSKGLTFIKFFAPWCGYCKGLAPTWEDLGKKISSYENIIIAKVDCSSNLNKELCSEQEVNGFPTLILYNNGEKVEEYTGLRSLEDLFEFVIKHANKNHDEL